MGEGARPVEKVDIVGLAGLKWRDVRARLLRAGGHHPILNGGAMALVLSEMTLHWSVAPSSMLTKNRRQAGVQLKDGDVPDDTAIVTGQCRQEERR